MERPGVMASAGRRSVPPLPLVLADYPAKRVFTQLNNGEWYEFDAEFIDRRKRANGCGANGQEQRIILPNYLWKTPDGHSNLLEVLSKEATWVPMLKVARERAFAAAKELRWGVEKDKVIVDCCVMESVAVAMCLFLAARFSTKTHMQRAVMMKGTSSFACAFEFHHMWMLAEFFKFQGIATRGLQWGYANLRIPTPRGSLYVIPPSALVEFRRGSSEWRVGSLNLVFVVWRICVGNGTISLEIGEEQLYTEARTSEIVAEIKRLLREWDAILGDRSCEVIAAGLLDWAQEPAAADSNNAS